MGAVLSLGRIDVAGRTHIAQFTSQQSAPVGHLAFFREVSQKPEQRAHVLEVVMAVVRLEGVQQFCGHSSLATGHQSRYCGSVEQFAVLHYLSCCLGRAYGVVIYYSYGIGTRHGLQVSWKFL